MMNYTILETPLKQFNPKPAQNLVLTRNWLSIPFQDENILTMFFVFFVMRKCISKSNFLFMNVH